MITSIKDTNNGLYEVLFAKASEILSGFKSVQTYDKDTQYWYKDSNSKSYKEYDLTNGSEEELTEGQLINNFADALVKYGKLYIKTREEPVAGFSPELGITSLEEYYNWLPELKADEEGKPTVFTKLPLDEPYFEIKANTRAITIPDEFKKNGVAVQGDDLAEVVYFMIDRYFDAVDLNNTEIYIEWETPKSKATGTVTKSVSEPYLKVIDDENYYGKLIFGWALSEAITKDSGTLKFAVRFIQRDNQNKIVYSFNTLTSQVTIHPNLGTDMATAIENADNCNARLLERIQESEVVGGAKAKVPYFLLDLVVLEDGYDIEDNHTDGSYTLYAVATADDTGAVSYVWRRGELNPDNSEEGTWVDMTEGDSLEMIALTEEELVAFNYKLPTSRVYHIGTSADDTTELDRGLYDLKASFTDKNQPIPTIYERRACLVVTEYGLYKAEARNRIFNSLTKADSNTVIFKRPDPVKMVDN